MISIIIKSIFQLHFTRQERQRNKMHIKALQPTTRSSVDFRYDFIFTELTVAAPLILAAAEFNVSVRHEVA